MAALRCTCSPALKEIAPEKDTFASHVEGFKVSVDCFWENSCYLSCVALAKTFKLAVSSVCIYTHIFKDLFILPESQS